MRARVRQRLLSVVICGTVLSGAAQAETIASPQSGDKQISAKAGRVPHKAKRKIRHTKLPQKAKPKAVRVAAATAENTWEIFGFTDGSDVDVAGARGIYHDSVLRTGRNVLGLATSTGIVYSPTNSLAIWWGIDSSYDKIGSDAGLDPSISRALGPSGGIKYQLLNRQQSPIGLAVQWSFAWEPARGGNQTYDVLAHEFRVLADWQVARDWFAAINFAYAPELDIYPAGPTERTHTVEISTAVTKRIFDRYFFGAELRHLSRFQTAFSGLEEQALYLGPTVLARWGEGYVGLAWSIRAAAGEVSGQQSSFGSQQFRLKAGLSF